MRRLLPASRSWYTFVVSATLAACGGGGDGGGTQPPPPTTPAAIARQPNTDGQTARVGTAVAVAPAVRVTNSAGVGLGNVTVTFAVTTGGGTLGATSAQTNSEGIATAGSWTLGPTVGANRVTASVGSLSTTFDATGEAAPTTPPPTNSILTASRVAVGGRPFKCVLRQSGVVSCWGENAAGQLGDGTTTFRERPVNLAVSGVTFSSIALGTFHGCALSSTGVAYCWGQNSTGVVGDNSTTNRPSPVAVAGSHVFTSLTAGTTYTCGLKTGGTVWCWGTQPGTGGAQRLAPTQLNAGGRAVVSLTVRGDQVCGAVSTGGVLCWTGNIYAAAPAVEHAGLTFATLTGGSLHLCGLTADNQAYCWGENAAGQVGDNTITDRAAPTAVVGPTRYTQIDAGNEHTCALATTGEVYCWGRNVEGQLGIGKLPNEVGAAAFPNRVAAPEGVLFQQIGAGNGGACAVATGTSTVYCWGSRAFDNNGQVYQGEVTPVTVQDQ